MNSEILDETKEIELDKYSAVSWLPMLILGLGGVVYFFQMYPHISILYIFSFIAFFGCVILFFTSKPYWLKLFTVCLLFWTIFVNSFPFPWYLSFSFFIGGFSIGIDFFPALILLLHYTVNKNKILEMTRRESPEDVALEQAMFSTSVRKFKYRFAQKSDIELTKILEENRLVPAALSAAKELLEERK